jgi:hypothetical protein
MLTSTELKTGTLTNTTVETEIALLNLNILSSVETNTVNVTGETETDVNGITVTGTPMTVSNVYYPVWQGTVTNTFIQSEMQKVIDYFSKLGYTINRKSDDMEHLFWTISW